MAADEFKLRARELSPLDHLISAAQIALTTIAGTPAGTGRADPAQGLDATELSDVDKRESVRLMRVNHVGEVCAQALYEGQALTARDRRVRDAMIKASAEEQDHLIWCENRLKLLRNDEFISLAGKFPRLKNKTAGPRLREVKKLLLAL